MAFGCQNSGAEGSSVFSREWKTMNGLAFSFSESERKRKE
jgi:hypothetical protein